MNKAHDKADGCSTSQAAAVTFEQLRESDRSPLIKYVTGVALLIVTWWLIYRQAVKRVVSQFSQADEAIPFGACGCKPCR